MSNTVLWKLKSLSICSWQAGDPRRGDGSILRAGRLETGRANVSLWVERQEKNQCSSSKADRQKNFPLFQEGSPFGFNHTFNWLDKTQPHLERVTCFTQSIRIFIYKTRPKSTLRNTWNKVWLSYGHPVAQSSWHIKFTITHSIYPVNLIRWILFIFFFSIKLFFCSWFRILSPTFKIYLVCCMTCFFLGILYLRWWMRLTYTFSFGIVLI